MNIQQKLYLNKKSEFILIVALAISMLLIILLRTNLMTYDHPDFHMPYGDHHKYIAMASENPFALKIAPFGWRVATPLLAKILPFDIQISFFIVTFIGLLSTAVTLYYVLQKFNFSKGYSVLGLLMFFSLGWAVKVPIYDFWLTEPLTFFCVTLIFYFIKSKNDLAFALTLAIGVTVKESVLFVAPLFYTLNTKKLIDAKLILRTVLYSVPAIFILILLRLLIPALNDDPTYINTLSKTLQEGNSHYNYAMVFKEVTTMRFSSPLLGSLKNFSVGTFGVMVMLLPFFAIKKNIDPFIRFVPFLLLVYSQLLFAYNTERLLVLAFPALIIMALNGISQLAKLLRLELRHLIPLPLLLIGLNLLDKSIFMAPFDLQALLFIFYIAGLFNIKNFNSIKIR